MGVDARSPVRSLMAEEPVTVAEDIRHAVVVDDDRVVGMVSARDLFRVVTDDLLDAWT